MQRCSVRLRRCDFIGRRGSAGDERSVRAAPCEPGASAVPYVADRVREHSELSVVKVECEDEDSVNILDPSMGTEDAVDDMGIFVKEEADVVVKMEDEEGEVMIEHELDIGPTVLQLQPAQCPLPSLNQMSSQRQSQMYHTDQASTSAPLPCASSGDSAASASLDTTLMLPASQTESGANCVLEVKTTDCYQGVLGECADNEGTSSGRKEGGRCACCAGSAGECDCGADVGRAAAEKLYPCGRSGGSACALTQITKHVLIYMGEKACRCELCEYSTSKVAYLKKHMHTHTGEEPYKPCEQCEYSASGLDKVNNHMSTLTSKRPYEWEQCKYCVSDLGTLTRHKRTHTGEKLYKCGQCEYSASQKVSLKRHMYNHTGEKPYKCEQCKYSASELDTLKKHMRTHTGEKPYKCEQCKYSATQKGSLSRHMHTHTGEKPYKCEQCKYTTSRLASLKNHMLNHMDEKPYKCKQCEYSAAILSNLKTHMRIHTGEKPYKCEQCEYSASQKGSLSRHMHTHTDEKPYKCKE